MRKVTEDDGTVYWEVLGQRLSEEEFERRFLHDTAAAPCSLVAFKPLASEALAVHPDQVEEARALAQHKGVPVEFLPDGRPRFTSSRQFRDYAKAHGFRHKGYT